MINNNVTLFLVAGLGNPGQAYRHNRHNAGFMVVDRLAKRLGVVFSKMESKALVTRGEYQGKRILIAKPRTFMNLSGQAIGALQRFYKLPLENLLVVYDDVDLLLGTIRIRPGGGSGGHNGMGSIIERLGSEEFPRLRLGIDRPPGRMEAADYVLQDFSSADLEFIEPVMEKAVDAILAFVADGLDTAMNRYNGGEEK
jgi:PTH1 family peptidyl-tRNA hydrolase